jgi:type II restriction enzyme
LEYVRNGEVKVINAETNEVVCSVPIDKFEEQADALLNAISSQNKKLGAFDVPEVGCFAESIKCTALKAKSQDKADIHLMVHDIMSGRDDTFGFSIKSQLGSPLTLFNVSGATNFIYKINGHKLTSDEIAKFENFKYFTDKFEFLKSVGSEVVFEKTDNDILDFNLKMVMTEMPAVFAEMIKIYYSGSVNKIAELTDIVAETGIVNTIDNRVLLRHKVKELLTNIALGMVPNTKWTGDYEATGGYIIVKDDGDVVCYHIYNHNAFKNYMFENTRFDTPSKSKHHFGTIYTDDTNVDKQFLKLNVQIRFLK